MKNRAVRLLVIILFIAYCLLLARFIVFKGPFHQIADHFRNYHEGVFEKGYEWSNFTPFRTLYYYLSLQEDAGTGLRNIGGNIFLFIPYGFLIPLVFRKARTLMKVLLIVLFSSLFFELLQLMFAIGNFDVDDLLLNGIGGTTGYAFSKLLPGNRLKD